MACASKRSQPLFFSAFFGISVHGARIESLNISNFTQECNCPHELGAPSRTGQDGRHLRHAVGHSLPLLLQVRQQSLYLFLDPHNHCWPSQVVGTVHMVMERGIISTREDKREINMLETAKPASMVDYSHTIALFSPPVQ